MLDGFSRKNPKAIGAATLRASDSLTVTGDDPVAGSPTGIFAQSVGDASGSTGDVLIEVGALVLQGGGVISSTTFGTGNGSKLTIRVRESLTITGSDVGGGDSGIFARAAGGDTSGAAGDMLIEAGTLTLQDGGRISSSTSGSGRGGSVTIQASKLLTITGRDPVDSSSSRVAVSSSGEGQAGNISIYAGALQLLEGAEITASATNIGGGGSLSLNVAQTLLIEQSEVRTDALQADGGDVDITANAIQLRDGGITTAVGRGDGRGGNITINASLGLLERSEIQADAFGGPGGNITIQTDGFITDASSVVSASSQQSVDGAVTIQGLADLAGSLTAIDPSFASTASLMSNRCASRLQGSRISRFTLASRDRVPTSPGGILPSPHSETATRVGALGRHRTLSSSALSRVVMLSRESCWQ